MLSCYIAKHVQKFSDSFTEDILADGNGMSGDSTAAAILCRYKPLQPEMVLQLYAKLFPQWRSGTTTQGARQFVLPCPEDETMSKDTQSTIEAYERCVSVGIPAQD